MGPLMQMFQQMPQRQMQAAPVRQPMGFPMPVKPVGMYDAPIEQRQRIVGPGGTPPPVMAPPQPGGLAQLLANSKRPVSTRVRPVDPLMPVAATGGMMPGSPTFGGLK